MKKLVLFVIVIAGAVLVSATRPIQDCKRKSNRSGKEIPLWGRVQVVNAHADFTVKVVNAHADLDVKKVNAFANSCGEWQFVEAHADFTVKFVDAHADFTIKYVNSFPRQRR